MDELLAGSGEPVVLKQGHPGFEIKLAFLIRELELVLPEAVAVGWENV